MSSGVRWTALAILLLAVGTAVAQDVADEQQENAPAPGEGGQIVKEVPNIFSGLFDSFDYEPRGRRDPFSQTYVSRTQEPEQPDGYGPLLPLQRFKLEDLRLTGILWNVSNPKAILKDPTGNIHVVTLNSKIGTRNGYVAAIREGEIVVVETIEQDGRLISTAQVVKIAK